MSISRFRLLFPFSSLKPVSFIPLSNTRFKQFFCTQSEKELAPEDTFGGYTSSPKSKYYTDEDESNVREMTILEGIQKIRKFVPIYDFDQAKKVFDELKKARKPPPYVYKLLFVIAGRLGKVEEAYKLYNDLKKRGLYADGAMYTSLFYACAKCPRSDIALPIADKLLEDMFTSKNYKPNKSNFNAALMAYGRQGDISRAMLLVDKLEREGITLSHRNYTFALESCISQRNTGLRFAILFWHHMLNKNIVPQTYAFTILARCVRDCSLGDSDLANDFIKSVYEMFSKKRISQTIEGKSDSRQSRIKSEKGRQQFYIGGQTEGNVKETDISAVNNKSSPTDGILDAQNIEVEVTESAGNVSLDTENDEKIQQDSRLVKAESSDNCSLIVVNTDESQSQTDHVEIAASEKAICSTVGNNKYLVDISDAANGSQVTGTQSADEFSSKEKTHQFDQSDLPNLLTLKPPGESIMELRDFSTPENRLMLFGGLNGFLETMQFYKAKPDIVVFSILLQCIPSTQEDEEALMKEMKTFKVKVDGTFLNTLIQRRILRNEKSTPEDFLALFEKYRCSPDVVTIGTIARSCLTHESGKKCIELARSHNIRLNNAILQCLLKNAEKTGDMLYVSDILKAAKEDDTELDVRFMSQLKHVVKMEKIRRKKLALTE